MTPKLLYIIGTMWLARHMGSTDCKHKACVYLQLLPLYDLPLQVLVLAPTQELCMQVLRAARWALPSNSNSVQPLVGEL